MRQDHTRATYTVFLDRENTLLSVLGMIDSITEVAGSVIARIEIRRVRSEVSAAPSDKLAARASGRCTNLVKISWKEKLISPAFG